MQLFDGNYHAKVLDSQIKTYIEQHPQDRKLCIVQVGTNPESGMYIHLKVSKCNELGVPNLVKLFPDGAEESEVAQAIGELTRDPTVKSVIVQLPLPSGFRNRVLDMLPYEMDVDVLCSQSKVKFYTGAGKIIPPVVRATIHFLTTSNIDIKNKRVILLGSGELVGQPLSSYFKKNGAEVVTVDPYRKGDNLDGNLVVLATGNPKLVIGQDISSGADVIDFGSSVVNGRSVGDLDMNSELSHLNIISPSPGGMGPLVIRYLIMNHLGL